ncbi:MAG TPA: head GIN domain-containing protein [Chitinophagaceae bacterium]
MRKILFLLMAALAFVSCRVNTGKRVKGNGNVNSETRNVDQASRVKISGNFQVELVKGRPGVRIEADENLLRYIVTRNENGWLVIRSRENYRLRSEHPIRVFVSTDAVEAIHIAGSTKVRSAGKFDGSEKLDIDIAGSGEVDMNVNTPVVAVDIAGSGEVRLEGETRDATVDIKGAGSYDASQLLTEKTEVDITGSGEANVHADVSLDAHIIGSGTVYYRGNANVKSKTTGSGKIARMQ